MPTTVQTLPPSARNYSRAQRAEIKAAVAAIERQWRRMGSDFDMSWARTAGTMYQILTTAQKRIVDQSLAYIPDVLEDTDQKADQVARIQPRSLIGVSGSGIAIPDVLNSAPIRAKEAIQRGGTQFEALKSAGLWLTGTAGTILSDTGRATEQLGMYTRPDIHGYVRMLSPPSCGRCAIQAGKRFRTNQGFQRHPRCDCRHIPETESLSDDLTVNPDAYFRSLDAKGQEKLAGSLANARAVREGADLGQVVNAYGRTAGMQVAQVRPIKVDRFGDKYTKAGTTKRGIAGKAQLRLRQHGEQQARLMPESIYRRARSQDDVLRLLKLYGWII